MKKNTVTLTRRQVAALLGKSEIQVRQLEGSSSTASKGSDGSWLYVPSEVAALLLEGQPERREAPIGARPEIWRSPETSRQRPLASSRCMQHPGGHRDQAEPHHRRKLEGLVRPDVGMPQHRVQSAPAAGADTRSQPVVGRCPGPGGGRDGAVDGRSIDHRGADESDFTGFRIGRQSEDRSEPGDFWEEASQ